MDTFALEANCVLLDSIAQRLERLVDELHASHVPQEARRLATALDLRLSDHLYSESTALQLVPSSDEGSLAEAVDRTLAEHAAMRELVRPVIRALRSIGQEHFPAIPPRFVFAALVLSEFMRLHARFKREALYPLLANFDTRRSNERV